MKAIKNISRLLVVVLTVVMLFAAFSTMALAAETETAAEAADTAASEAESENELLGKKAFAAAIAIGIVATAGAIGMSMAICKSVDSIARQPEAEGKIRTALMLGLVFVETAIIYALIVAVLIIFVL